MVRQILVIGLAAFVLGACTEPSVDTDSGDVGEDSDVEDSGGEDGSADDGGEDAADDADDTSVEDTADDADDTSVEDTADGEDTSDAADEGPGTSIGTFENTYYYLADEQAHAGEAVDTLYDPSCEPIATVSESFANAACIEGSAKLGDDRVINYYLPCDCGGPCSFCWSVMDPDEFPWGKGSQGNPLEPLRSWAVDTDLIDYGTILYVEEWDGMELPEVGELGGYAHDGCFRADDVGGGIDGFHVDFFAGSRAMWQELEALFATRTEFTVYEDSPRCVEL